jgi:hypothetical protein
MRLSIRRIIWSFVIFIVVSGSIYILGKLQKDGVVSNAWVLYYLEWIAAGCLGLILFIVSIAKQSRTKKSFFYVFIGVANFGNAIVGLLLLRSPGGVSDSTGSWLQLGATALLAILIIGDVLMNDNPSS